jgi:hypothetical protein
MKLLFPSTLLVPLFALILGSTAICEPAADPGPAPSPEEMKSYTALTEKGVLVQPLAAGINWRYINFRGAEKADSSVFALLKGAAATVDLDLTGQKLTDADAAVLSSLTNLKKLSLARSTITDAGLAAVKSLPKLESLNLFSTEISDAGLSHLSGLKSLKRLYVFQTKTTEAGIGKLKAAIPGVAVEVGAKLTVPPPPEPKKEEPKKEDPAKKPEPAKPDPAKPAEPAKKVEPPKAPEPAKPEPPKPAEPAKKVEPPKAPEPPKPEPPKPAEPAKKVEPPKAPEPAKPAPAKPAEPAKPSEPAKAAADAPKPLGYQDTAIIPGTQWHVHDGLRPQPKIITPGGKPGDAPSDSVVLFDGKDLSKFKKNADGKPNWTVQDGAAISVKGSGYLESTDEFGPDVQLHVEWAAPTPAEGTGQGRGNSGVFIFGRYEIQVLDSYGNQTYPDGQAAALYGQTPPLVNACRPAGEWQTYDIIFTGPRFEGTELRPAYATILHNGVVVQNHTTLIGETGHKKLAKYTPHLPKGPIRFQDHGNPVRFRNIWIRELKPVDSQ